MLRWFGVKEVDKFADSVVAELLERFPPGSIDLQGKKAVAKARRTFGSVLSRVDQFVQANNLNLYKKARLGNRIKWALKGAGYPDQFVDEMTRELVMHVALASRAGRGRGGG